MQIIWDKEVVEQLRNSHTLLELETFEVKGEPVTTYCVVPAEKLLADLPQLPVYTDLHEGFVKALNENNLKLCEDIYEHLKGHFGGELDSFYEVIIERLKTST